MRPVVTPAMAADITFSVRRSKRSARAPETGASRMTGPWVRNKPSPTQKDEWVVCRSCKLRINTSAHRPDDEKALLHHSQT